MTSPRDWPWTCTYATVTPLACSFLSSSVACSHSPHFNGRSSSDGRNCSIRTSATVCVLYRTSREGRAKTARPFQVTHEPIARLHLPCSPGASSGWKERGLGGRPWHVARPRALRQGADGGGSRSRRAGGGRKSSVGWTKEPTPAPARSVAPLAATITHHKGTSSRDKARRPPPGLLSPLLPPLAHRSSC